MSITFQNNKVILTGFDRFRYKPLSIPKNLWKHRKTYLSLKQVETYIKRHPKTTLAKKLQSMVVRPSLKIHLSDINFQEWQKENPKFPWETTTVLSQFINSFSKELEGGKLSLNKVVQQLKLFSLLVKLFEDEVWDMEDIHDRYTGLQVAEILRGNVVKATEKVVNQINALSFGYSGKKAAINSQKLRDLVGLCNPGRAIKQMRRFINRHKIEEFQKENDPKFKEFMLRRWVSDYEAVRRYELLAQALSRNSNQMLKESGEHWLSKSNKAFEYVHDEIFPRELSQNKVAEKKEDDFIRVMKEGKATWVKRQSSSQEGEESLKIDFTDVSKIKQKRADANAEMDRSSPVQAMLLYKSLIKCCDDAGYNQGEFKKKLRSWINILNDKEKNKQSSQLAPSLTNLFQEPFMKRNSRFAAMVKRTRDE